MPSSEHRYGYAEISAALRANDEAVEPGGPEDDPQHLLDPVGDVLRFHDVDPEGVTEASMQRALRIAESGEIDMRVILVGGFPLLASWGAAWMDGFAAALRLVQGVDEESV